MRENIAKSRTLRQFLESILNLRGGERILDVGCGIGTLEKLLYPLLRNGAEIIGIDIAANLIDYGNLHWAHRPNTHLEVGDANEIAYPDASFDVVISLGLLEFTNQDRVLSEMARVLKPSGILVVVQIDVVHYIVLPQNELFNLFYNGTLEGMRRMGADLELKRFKECCQDWDWVLEEFDCDFEYRTQITDRFIQLLEEQNRVSYYENKEYIEQVCEFNFQFLQQIGWTKQQVKDYLTRDYSLETQINFFREQLGEDYYQRTPIHVFRVHL